MRNLAHTVFGYSLRKKWIVGICSCMAILLVASATIATTFFHLAAVHASYTCQFAQYVPKQAAQETQSDSSGTYTLWVDLWAQVDIHNGAYCCSEYASATLTM